ncbi:hypothetical protein ACN42_g1513 [Penicillium freii]|uniref:Uncharacterized protein n=1 Tax=Penicillium freii TaxID=48697 RepID=A0A101MRT4_PENFR|nr:hypothetical protein ACN42_g1513 [Penicillium freii]
MVHTLFLSTCRSSTPVQHHYIGAIPLISRLYSTFSNINLTSHDSNIVRGINHPQKLNPPPTNHPTTTLTPSPTIEQKESQESKKIDRRRDRTCNLLIRSQAPCHWASRPV